METTCVRCGTARDILAHPECLHCWGPGKAKTRAQVEREARREREYRSAEQRAELDFQQGAAERGRTVRGWSED
jgi:hypothetical protein